MGKKRRLNRFISKWIKSDLPSEDRSTVLLLAVTRIPTSPVASRRPCVDKRRPVVRRGSSSTSMTCKRRNGRHQVSSVAQPLNTDEQSRKTTQCPGPVDATGGAAEVMESSVDSIGTCSLDVDASTTQLGAPDLSAEATSTDTLRSASITTPSDQNHHHLPSYLSLACTVNGYSTITNYDPVRLAKSRDASPHRPDLTPKPSFSIQSNLLSPPNLIVPLPRTKMEDVTQYYSGMKSSRTFKESRFSQFLSKDTVDSCIENGHIRVQTKCSSFESKTSLKYTSDISETKSFIQQSVERLYGPGALAQGFFISKRQKEHRFSDCEDKPRVPDDKHSKSMNDELLEDEFERLSMKQSTSSPTLPVLRHLRPEFRAQLPIHSPKKGPNEGPKGAAAKLDEEEELEVKMNGRKEGERDGHVKISNGHAAEKSNGYIKVASNGEVKAAALEEDQEGLEAKDGHYFLKILEAQTKRLLALADRVEGDLSTPGLSEEVIGKLRSASGKARLLASQKMQQFRGLCNNNINRSLDEAFPTTNEDLQGFWDMVMLQVNQVYAIFEDIDELRRNDWLETKVEPIPATNGAATKAKRSSGGASKRPSPPTSGVTKQRELERKKMIEERRKAMRAQKKMAEGVEIFVAESS